MKVIFWGLVAVAFAYAAYGVMMSGYQYLTLSNVVDDATQKQSLAEHPTPRELKAKIVKDSVDAGVPLTDRDVAVTMADRVVTVNIIWTFPMIMYKGEPVLAIPLSLKRTKEMTAGSVDYFAPAGRAFASAISRSTRARSSPGGATFTKRSHERIAPGTSFFAS
jgi:hypothetical protein